MEKKITIMGVLQEGLGIGLKNALSLLGAVVLWILTIWIPYINVGTTIAISAIPIELSKGKIISPLFIFDEKYRQFMGEYFSLIGLMAIAIWPAMLFLIVPGIVIAIGWSLSIFLLIDKQLSPTQAMLQSNKATYGYKWTIFGVGFLLMLAACIVGWIFSQLGSIGSILNILLLIVLVVANLGCNSVIYRDLTKNNAAPAVEDAKEEV